MKNVIKDIIKENYKTITEEKAIAKQNEIVKGEIDYELWK